MRKPAPKLDRGPARTINCPEVGFFKVRLVARGPWVPASITRPCHCTVNGGDDGAEHAWAEDCDRHPPLVGEIGGLLVDDVCEQIWHANSRAIDELEYAALVFERSLEDA